MGGIKTVPARVDFESTLVLEHLLTTESIWSSYYHQLKADGWKFFAVNQRCGRCYYGKKWVTIPMWVVRRKCKQSNRPGFWIWYISHELAHTQAGAKADHGIEFMRWLKRICPPEFVHYELEYKPETASHAGISWRNARKEEDVSIPNLEDLL